MTAVELTVSERPGPEQAGPEQAGPAGAGPAGAGRPAAPRTSAEATTTESTLVEPAPATAPVPPAGPAAVPAPTAPGADDAPTLAEPGVDDDTVPAAVAPRRPGVLERVRRFVAAVPRRITDAAVLAFALYTVLYHLAFPFGWAPSLTFRIWLTGCALLALLRLVVAGLRERTARRPAATVPQDGTTVELTPPARRGPRWWWVLPAFGVGVAAAVTAGIGGTMPWWWPASLGLVASVAVALLARRSWLVAGPDGEPAPTVWQTGYVLLVSAGVAVSSLYMARNTPDDVFYLGKSVWVAERDSVPVRDFLFTEEVLPGLSTQPPISSIEVFAGALGRFLGLHAADATWFVLLPVLAVLAVLALWRLVHRWAPRRPMLAFTVAVGYLYLVAGSDAALGTFHLPRLYEGKGMFVSAAVPLMWVYLTDWLESRSRWKLFLIFALGVASAGLTSTAAIILPILVGAAAFAMLLVGRWLPAVLAFAAAVAYPLGSVVVSRLALGPVTEVGGETQFFDAEGTYRRTLLVGSLGVIGGLALWVAPLLMRHRTPRLLAAGAAVTMSVLFVPGVLEFLADLTGIAAVLWRVPWILALPGLIGILCTVRLPWPARLPLLGPLPWTGRTLKALTSALVAAVLLATFSLYGTPMWHRDSFVETHPHPVWKVPQDRLGRVEWIQSLTPARPPGLLLAPSTLMRLAPILSSELRVVLPRDGYLIEYDWNSEFAQDRLRLAAFADGEGVPPDDELAATLDRLDVTTVCLYFGNRAARRALERLDFEVFGEREDPAGSVRCLRKLDAGAPPPTD
ncbi:hypothetical protein AWW66_15760 [Micromonospora rosaria]|uniref:Uncharacterized protein n=1 Tax=Micromonospora rosaria TaxID=47874 RepID=A0A136PRR2_9ACTN|nr:DUF6077 domain-containing protein [Micromonospora rosaria]KXK61014.1 hypothetical protein AWW66_15760 [Micromonospora rosaria]